MKTKILLLLVVSAASLSGCMVYPRHGYGGHRGDGDGGGQRHRSDDHGSRRDRDGDGTRNRYDRAPNNPYVR